MKYPNPYIPTGKTGYYVTLQFSHENNGKQFKRSLKTSDKREAKKRVRALVDEYRTGGFVAPSRRNQVEKIGEVIKMYNQGVDAGLISIERLSANAAIQTFYRVLNATHTKEAVVERQKLSLATRNKLDAMRIDDALTGPISDNFSLSRINSNMKGIVESDNPTAYHMKLERTKRAINDQLLKCHSIFGNKARPYYDQHFGFDPLKVKEVKSFMGEKLKHDQKKIKKTPFKAPSQATYERLLNWINSLKVELPDEWIVLTMCLSAGCRGKEVHNTVREFFKLNDNNPAITTLCLPTHACKTSARDIPMSTALVHEIFRVAEAPRKVHKKGGRKRFRDARYLIGGEQILENCRNLLAKEFGSDLQNDDDDGRLHTLRKIFGSKILSRTRDIAYVSKLLGHTNIQTTMDVYVDHDSTVEPTVVVDILQPQVAVVKEEKVA